MALRNIIEEDCPRLRKKCKPVKEVTKKICDLLDDMAETMYQARGVGLAAPQVGILKRIVVIDVGEGLIELINPEIVETEGQQREEEGCLSLPAEKGIVLRPARVKVRALNRRGEKIEVEGEDLLARALCHETDHLDGVLFIDKVIAHAPEEEEEMEE